MSRIHVALGGLVLAVWCGCGAATGTCNVNNCSHGCCDSTGTCQSAGTDEVCGMRGNACFPCEGAAHCSQGSCLRDCDLPVHPDAGTLMDAGFDAGTDAGTTFDAGTDAGADAGSTFDAGVDAGAAFDAGPDFDAGVDAGVPDAGAGLFDAGLDAGAFDAGVDAGEADAGVDAGPFDAGLDAGEPDAGFDAGDCVDAGAADAGIDAGLADAGARVCRVLNTFPMVDGFSVYGRSADAGAEHAVADKVSANMAPYDTLEIDVYWAFTGHQTGVMIPSVRDLAIEPNYSICTACVVIREDCVALDSCARAYLARSGTITLDDITRNYSGQFKATLSNVRLEAWALGLDTPLVDGGCIILNSATFDIPR